MGTMQLNCGRAPAAAKSIGLGDNFRYWRGATGRRYLFSLVREADLSDLQNVIVIRAAVKDGEPVPVWLGDIDADGIQSGYAVDYAAGSGRSTFVHFLAGSDDGRRAAMLDLAGGRA